MVWYEYPFTGLLAARATARSASGYRRSTGTEYNKQVHTGTSRTLRKNSRVQRDLEFSVVESSVLFVLRGGKSRRSMCFRLSHLMEERCTLDGIQFYRDSTRSRS